MQSNMCKLSEMSVAVKLLRQALKVGVDDPNAMESYLRQSSAQTKSGVKDGKYAEDDELNLLISTLDECVLKLRANHPEVADAVEARLKRRLRANDDAKRLVLAGTIEDLR